MKRRKRKDAPALSAAVYRSAPALIKSDPAIIASGKISHPAPWRVVWQSSMPGLKVPGKGRYIIIAANGLRISGGHAAALRIVEAVNAHEHASENN